MTLYPSPTMDCDGMPVGENVLEDVILIYLLRDTKEIVTIKIMALMAILKFKYCRLPGLFQYDTIMNAEIKLEIFFMVCPIIIWIEKLKYFKLISGM